MLFMRHSLQWYVWIKPYLEFCTPSGSAEGNSHRKRFREEGSNRARQEYQSKAERDLAGLYIT